MTITKKRYRCEDCGNVREIETNHYGEVYEKCPKCGWKHPMKLYSINKCIDEVPEGGFVPEPWKMTTLGDLLGYDKS